MAFSSSWTWGQKTIGGRVFLLKFPIKKAGISCSACAGITKVEICVA